MKKILLIIIMLIATTSVRSQLTYLDSLQIAKLKGTGNRPVSVNSEGVVIIGENSDLSNYRLKTDHDSLQNLDEKSYNSLTDKPNLSVYLTSEKDSSPTNELQTLYLGGKVGTVQFIMLSNGGQVGVDVADNDNSSTNEIQDLTLNGNILSLSGDGTPVDLSSLASPNLSNYATIIQLRDSVAYLKTLIPTVETTATIKTKLGIATNSTDGYLLATDWTTFNAKQATLVSGTNIKTVNSTSLLGSGNISIAPMVYPSQGLAKSNGTGWDASITDNSALWNRAVTVSDSLKNDVLDTSSVNINKPNWTKFIQSVTAVQGIPKVGDFYGGGYVYYVSSSGTYGYCVYPDVIGTGSCYYSPTNNGSRITSDASVGGGITNTTAIVAVFGSGNYAAYRCDTLTKAGYTDWALPSSGDMDLIHDSLYSKFTAYGYYFTSTESGASNAYGYYFSPTGELSDVSKAFLYSDYKTLAIRRFTVSPQTFNLGVSENDGSPSYSAINSIQFANCVLTQPTNNTVLVTPNSAGSMTGDQIVAALNANDSTTLTKAIASPEFVMKNTNAAYDYFWSAYYDSGTDYGIYLSQNPKGGYSREFRYEAANNILYIPRINLENGSYVNSIGTGAATSSSTTKLVTEDMLVKSISASGGGDMSRSVYDTDTDNIVDNAEKLGGQLPSYYMANSAATSSNLGGVKINGNGIAIDGNGLLYQEDNTFTSRTPILTDPIAFYDASATAQGKTTFAEIRTIMNGVQTLTSSTSITMNFATAPKGSLALGTSATLTITNLPDGGEGSIEVTSSGAYTLAIAGSTGYTTTQKMGTVSAIASSAHTTVFYWRTGSTLYYGFLLNN